MHLPIIWIEIIPLLQVYFSYFIEKQGTIFKDICIREGTQCCSACSSSGLIYYGPENCSFRRQIPRANYCIIIIIYYEVLCIVFLKNCIFCVLALERQVSFSERYSLISGILQGLVKTCKKYIEVNHFSLLSCSLEN